MRRCEVCKGRIHPVRIEAVGEERCKTCSTACANEHRRQLQLEHKDRVKSERKATKAAAAS